MDENARNGPWEAEIWRDKNRRCGATRKLPLIMLGSFDQCGIHARKMAVESKVI